MIDPRADARSPIDGKQLLKMYREYGLHIEQADNAVATGIRRVWEMLTKGLLKICENIAPFWKEFRIYHADAEGRPVKEHDHMMDLVRYFVMSGIERMKTEAGCTRMVESHEEALLGRRGWSRRTSWMAG